MHPDQKPLTVARTHRDKGNDADITINLPAMHDKSSCLGTVRSSRRSGHRSAVGLCVWLRTDHRFGTASRDRLSDLVAEHIGGYLCAVHSPTPIARCDPSRDWC